MHDVTGLLVQLEDEALKALMYTLLAQDYFQPVKMVGKFIDYCLNFVGEPNVVRKVNHGYL